MNFISQVSQGKNFIRYFVIFCFLVLFGWILEENIAFTGVHEISISSFGKLPGSVRYAGGSEVGLVATPVGQRARPFRDQVKFAVTLPRGFDTVTMRAEVDADPFSTLLLGAKLPNGSSQVAAFQLPTAFGGDWRTIAMNGGRLQLRDHEDIQSEAQFWKAFKTFRNVYTMSGDLASAIPNELYAPAAQLGDIHLAADYRGPLVVNTYLDGGTKDVRFSKKDLDYVPGDDTLQFTLERGGKIIASSATADGTGQNQDVVVSLPPISGGFFTLRFAPNNEDSIVRNVQFRGAEATLQGRVFLGPVANAVTLYTTCPKFTIEPVHNLGLQSSVTVNGRAVILRGLKQEQEVQFTGSLGTIVIPRGDVSLTSSCGFLLNPEQPIHTAYASLAKRITRLPEFTNSFLKNVDVVFDGTPLAPESEKYGYVIEETFNLHTLSAKGRTFTFSLESPGLAKRDGAYLYIEKVTFTARRPAFRFSDIKKILNRIR